MKVIWPSLSAAVGFDAVTTGATASGSVRSTQVTSPLMVPTALGSASAAPAALSSSTRNVSSTSVSLSRRIGTEMAVAAVGVVAPTEISTMPETLV